MNELKSPPHSIEAERAVLGSIMMDTMGRDGDRVWDICSSSGITPESFFDPRNRVIYQTMAELSRASKPLDHVSLFEALTVSGRMEMVGGAAYIQSLFDQTPTTAHAEYYIDIVRAKHLRRILIDRSTKVIENCLNEHEYPDPQAVLGNAERSFLEIGVRGNGTMPWSNAVELSFKRIDRMFSSKGTTLEGLSTGFRYLDEKLQGLKDSEMIVIAARPSVGKTSLAMNIAECVALGQDILGNKTKTDGGKKHPVLVFSLEMPVEALSKRMIAGRANVNTWRLNRNLCTSDERKVMLGNLYQAVSDLKDAALFVDDTASLDVMDMRARARRMKKQHGIELIVIDYLQLCTCREAARQASRQIEVSMISQQIKAMAKELRIPVIVLSQLSRANEQRGDKEEKPKLSDLRDSGAIEQDADVVFLLRRPSRTATASRSDDERLAIIDIAKNRNGETGEVDMTFFREYTRFCDREPKSKTKENFKTSEPPPEYRQDSLPVDDPLG